MEEIVKKQYLLLKTIRLVILIALMIFFVIILLFVYKRITIEASVYSSIPSSLNLLYLILYIPILITGICALRRNKRKLKELFPEKHPLRGPITKKVVFRIVYKTVIKFAIIIGIILLIAPFGITYVLVNHHVYYRNNSLLQMTYQASDFGLEDQELHLKTEDGITVWASEITVTNPKAVVIFLTGIEQPSITQFYPQAKLFKNYGYASILLEVRGHGKSGGNRVCLGYDEILDVKATLDYIKSKSEYHNVPIVIQGVSMGGAVAVNAFGQYKDIDALIAMSAYPAFEDVVIDNMRYFKVPDYICAIEKPIFKLALIANFGAKKVNNMKPITQIQNSNNRPIFLIASSGDTSVPVNNTKKLYSVSNSADVWIRDSLDHFIVKDCVLTEVEEDSEYCDKILGFLEKVCRDY